MTNTRIQVAMVGVAFYLFAAAGTAEAAKGVKKAVPGTVHTVSGVVTSITPDKTGYGTFQVRTAQAKKKVGVKNAVAVNANASRQFSVSSSTRFEHHNDGAVSAVTPMALQRGQHVRIQTTGAQVAGQQAQSVHIITSTRSQGYFTRHRTSSYRPHYAHHTGGGHRATGVHHATHVHHAAPHRKK